MRASEIIEKKRDGSVLSGEEIRFFLNEYLSGAIPDYQMSAFLMAVYFRGMSEGELLTFTEVMRDSGETVDIPGHSGFLLDKHSTGGVGDKTTIALTGIYGCFGIGEIKLSGRGLGHTGGTVDKFEAIPGFHFPEDKKELIAMVEALGGGIMGSTDKIVPLDKKIYALRDVTGTVNSIPLIASSIMSKKLALGSDGILLDVKVGSGAFMKDLPSARELSRVMATIGAKLGRKTVSVLSDMEQPLGLAVGNANEVMEAMDTLKGKGPADFTELVATLVAAGLMMAGKTKGMEEGKRLCDDMIRSGKPLARFREFLAYAGADPAVVDDYALLPGPSRETACLSPTDGWVARLDAGSVGRAAMLLGAGRTKKEDDIDPGVGILLRKKIGDPVRKGEPLAILQYNGGENLEAARDLLGRAFGFSGDVVPRRNVILEILTS